jgi:hypothetical protein
LRLRHQDFFALIGIHNAGECAPFFTRLLTNARTTVELVLAYTGPIAFIGSLVGILYLVWKRQRYPILFLAVSLLALWINTTQYTRYFIAPLGVFLLCAGLALALFVRTRGRVAQGLAIIAILIYGGMIWLPFAITAAKDPAALALAVPDQREYIASDASGVGLAELRAALIQAKAKHVIGLLSNCMSLQLMIQDDFVLECPGLNPSGSNLAELRQLLAANRGAGTFAVIEDIPYVPHDVEGTLVQTIERPHQGVSLAIYDLAR